MIEAEVDQPFEVDDGGSGGERDLVACDAAVSQRRWPLVTSHAMVRSTIGRCWR